MTITRAKAAWVNVQAVQHFFGDQIAIASLPIDPEANMANYDDLKLVRFEPLWQDIYIGLRVSLTKNINKDLDYVNGMQATVQGVYRSGIRVKTKTGYTFIVYPWTDEHRMTYHPMRPGYANTLLKMQGATVDHLTIYLDKSGVPAAGYVALSRVRKDKDWRYVGWMTRNHFVPAVGWTG